MTESKGNGRNKEIAEFLTEELIDHLFGYAYKLCFSKEEAEDLCQEIIVQILTALRKNPDIEDKNSYIWKIAHNTYCDYVSRQEKKQKISTDYQKNDKTQNKIGFEDKLIEKLLDNNKIFWIKKEITYLGKIYREVMIMFYLDELSISDIANKLEIPQNRVKQRLYSARKKIKGEVSKMNKNQKSLKPNYLGMWGTGNFTDSNVWPATQRLLSKNVLISCNKKAKSAEELAKELEIPTVFVEDELKILEEEGCLDKNGNNKYRTDFIIVDFDLLQKIAKKHLELSKEIGDKVENYVVQNEDKIMNIDYLSQPDGLSFILWSMIPRFADIYESLIVKEVIKKLYQKEGIEERNQEWALFGFSVTPHIMEKYVGEKNENSFYGLDGADIPSFDKWGKVFMSNLYGHRLPRRFSHPTVIYKNPVLIMMLRSIGGLSIDSLDDNEKEIASKTLEKKLIRKEDNRLYPNILVFNKKTFTEFNNIIKGIKQHIRPVCKKMIADYIDLIKEELADHLIDQAKYFVEFTSNAMRHYLIEDSIDRDLLHVPDKANCGEGMWAVVEEK